MKISTTQSNPTQTVGGFPCPRCRTLVRFPIQALLTQPLITCSQCGLELHIDLGCSADVLENLRRYVDGLDDAGGIL